MLRVASCAKAISPKAAIQLTSIELVMGKPKTRPISPAFRDRPVLLWRCGRWGGCRAPGLCGFRAYHERHMRAEAN